MTGDRALSGEPSRLGAGQSFTRSYLRTLGTLFEALGVPEEPARVVEVGCGVGMLSRWLADRAGAAATVVGFDLDGSTVARARTEARASGPSNVRFAVADVRDLPVPDGSIDLVVCRQLLCVLSDPSTAIRNLVRLLRPGGELIAIEPATEQSVLDPQDATFTRLSQRLLGAIHEGWRLRRADPKIGLRTAQLFLESGLENIRAEAIAQLHLLSDARRSMRDVIDQLETETVELPPQAQELLRRGGFSLHDQRTRTSKAAARLANFLDDPSLIARSGYVRLMATQIVAVGRRT